MAEEQEESQEQENNQSQKKSSNLVLIIVIVVLIFTLLIGGVIVAMLLSGDDEVPAQQAQQQGQMMNDNAYDGGGGNQPMRQKASKRIESLDVGPMFPLDGFTINLLSDSGRRYLKTTINLELKDEESAEELEAKAPVIRDILIRVMTSKTLEEIATAKGKDKLKDQLVNQINLRLRDAEVKNIYFVEFVIQ